jgi:hypothetical protein
MSPQIQNRRQYPRGNDILTKIEDVTYTVLRNSQQNQANASPKQA